MRTKVVRIRNTVYSTTVVLFVLFENLRLYNRLIICAVRKPTTMQQVDCNSWTNCCTIRSDFLYTFHLFSWSEQVFKCEIIPQKNKSFKMSVSAVFCDLRFAMFLINFENPLQLNKISYTFLYSKNSFNWSVWVRHYRWHAYINKSIYFFGYSTLLRSC